jgi:pimeloyl-ACP methyl ester carboxylesterase
MGSVHSLDSTFTPSHRGGSGPPLLCLHGFMDTWRSWELVLPMLERRHDVLALTLPGHAGGPRIGGPVGASTVVDSLERAMDDAGFETAHIVGNSLGGYLSLQLASRGRARSVVALAPAGGWAGGDTGVDATHEHFLSMLELLKPAAAMAEVIVAAPEGRRMATSFITTNYEHIPPDLLAHQIRGAAGCEAAVPLIEAAIRDGWSLDAEQVSCPVRIVWGTADRVLNWPSAAARYRDEWLPNADWIELEGVGHCPQLDVPLEAAVLILGFTAP